MKDKWQICFQKSYKEPSYWTGCGGGRTKGYSRLGKGACITQGRWEEKILREDKSSDFTG